MAIAMPKAPTPPTPPVSPGLEQASGAVGGLPDFGASGQAAVEGVQQEARDAVRAGQEAAANARAAGERLVGTPERKNQNTEKQGPGDSKLPLNEAAGKDKAADGAGSRTTVQQPANLPQAAQGAPEGAAKTETKEASGLLPPDAHSSSAVMAYWPLLLIVCLAGVFLLARKLSSKKPGEPTPLERAAKEAALLAEIEAQRTQERNGKRKEPLPSLLRDLPPSRVRSLPQRGRQPLPLLLCRRPHRLQKRWTRRAVRPAQADATRLSAARPDGGRRMTPRCGQALRRTLCLPLRRRRPQREAWRPWRRRFPPFARPAACWKRGETVRQPRKCVRPSALHPCSRRRRRARTARAISRYGSEAVGCAGSESARLCHFCCVYAIMWEYDESMILAAGDAVGWGT